MGYNSKYILNFILLLSFVIPCRSYAELSYGSKFLITTISGCGVGGTTAYFLTSNNGYDHQPAQIVTWMGATTGCLTGALFSYLFYNDNTERLNTKISEQNKTIQDLTLQMSEMQGQKQNGTFNPKYAMLPNPFDSVNVKEGIAKFNVDAKNLPAGLNIRNCNRLWQFTLKDDGNSLESSGLKRRVVAVNKNFALVGFTFLYSPQECFSPSLKEGHYADAYFPGLSNFLEQRIQNWSAEQSKFEKEKDTK